MYIICVAFSLPPSNIDLLIFFIMLNLWAKLKNTCLLNQWPVASGEWPVASGHDQWPPSVATFELLWFSLEWPVASGQWRVASGGWPVADGQWRVAGDQW